MDIDRFIPLIIVFFIWKIISAAGKQKTSGDETAKPEDSTLVKLIKTLQGQADFEDMAGTARERNLPWAEQEDLHWEKPVTPKKSAERSTNAVKENHVEKASTRLEALPKEQNGTKSHSRQPKYILRKQKQLRQAIVWKELLDKPLALRDSQ